MTKMETINIIFSSDNNYAQHLGVTLISLLINFKNKKYNLIINILDGGISEENKINIKSIVNKYDVKVMFFLMDKKTFTNCPEIRHLKLAAYYRILIPEIIPENIKKVIYLDSDIAVIGDISKLFEQNINNYFIGAVKEISQEEVLKVWGDDGVTKYFNSGVLLINLEKWRQYKISDKVFDFINKNKIKIKWADQDALNVILANQWFELENRFNLQVSGNYKKEKTDIIIVHYVGPIKPWHFSYFNYYSKYYWFYIKITPWKTYKCPDFSFYNLIKKCIKKIPYAIEIKKMLLNLVTKSKI